MISPDNLLRSENESVRKANFAGKFYSSESLDLRREVEGYLQGQENKDLPVRLLISPHAGYIFSAPVAAKGFALLDKQISRVVLLGPSHYKVFTGIHVSTASFYETPLGRVAVDKESVEQLRDNPIVVDASDAERLEHSLEVQLPFLQTKLEQFSIVPIIMGKVSERRVAEMLLSFLDDKTIIIASSDLSHFMEHSAARYTDDNSIETIIKNRKDGFIDGCGESAIRVVMHLAQLQKLKPELLDARTSYETNPRYGSSRVVGYASIIYVDHNQQENCERCEKRTDQLHSDFLDSQTKHQLLKLARNSIESAVKKTEFAFTAQNSEILNRKSGCFITLTKAGNLRGCIGCIEPVKPLFTSVKEYAVKAAMQDPRFPSLCAQELTDVEIEISVLTPLREVKFTTSEELLEQIEVGVDGVVLKKGFNEATFLPQVWKQLPDKEKFLTQLSLKGNMGSDGWKDAEVWVYNVVHFQE
ncbi:AMMECR1 domain protein [Chitinispirillum alkaliphilum]|nr:AMMECR1 domain protein [Chitinispirillum alkaliphilum]